MKPFKFRLEKILDYKKYREKKAQIDLYNARSEFVKLEKAIENLEDVKKKIGEKCDYEEFNGIEIPRYKIYQTFLAKLEHDIEKAHIKLKKKEKEISTKETILKTESIKKKTFEMLKEIKYTTYRKNLDREEQKAMDEIAIFRKGQRL